MFEIQTALQTSKNSLFWTRVGIVRLDFFIKSERAKRFRDWAEAFIANGISEAITPTTELTLTPLHEKIRGGKS